MTWDSFKSRVRENSGVGPILVVDDFHTVHDLRAFMRAAKLYADQRLIKIVLAMPAGEVARQMLDYSTHRKAVQQCVKRCMPVSLHSLHHLT
jgi:hypothetical protein